MITFKEYFLLTEAASDIPEFWYHGTTTNFSSFDYGFVCNDESFMEHGPGFYLTDSPAIAKNYAKGNGYLLKIKLTRRLRIKNDKTRPTALNIQKFVSRMPDREDVLADWGESPYQAESALINTLETSNDTLLELVQSMWYDCYKGHEPFFVRQLVMRSGIDGIMIPQQNDVNFLIAYNPNILKIVESERIIR